jgi:hypothetical protein
MKIQRNGSHGCLKKNFGTILLVILLWAAHHLRHCMAMSQMWGALPNNKEATRSSVAEVIQELQDQAIVLKEHLAKAQNKMKHAADKKRRHQEYQVGNMFF